MSTASSGIGPQARATTGAPTIGVLALQGDFAAHRRALEEAGAAVREVRVARDLQGLRGLVIPGGESSTLLRLMRLERMDQAISRFHREGGALLGTCAGMILLASRVRDPEQDCLGLCDLEVRRNGYGRQIDSFVGCGRIRLPGEEEGEAEMVFIRAPRILAVGSAATAVAWMGKEPVAVIQGRILVTTFHPEMSPENIIHAYFLRMSMAPRDEKDRAGAARPLDAAC